MTSKSTRSHVMACRSVTGCVGLDVADSIVIGGLAV